MNYLKIAELAHKCEIKAKQIGFLYSIVGSSDAFTFTKEQFDRFYFTIGEYEKELLILEKKLLKLLK